MNVIFDKLDQLNFEHNLWMNEMKYTTEEITLFQKRIEQLINPNGNDNLSKSMYGVLNEFKNLRKLASGLKLKIRRHISEMNHKIFSNGEFKAISNSIHHETLKELAEFRAKYQHQKEVFYGLSPMHNQED